MTAADDPRLAGRPPEFSRKSLRPGIGAGAMEAIASLLDRHGLPDGDVPTTLRVGGKRWPLGRYLRVLLRGMVGHGSQTPENVKAGFIAAVSDLWESTAGAGPLRARAFSDALARQSDGEVAALESLERLFHSKRVGL